MAEIFKTNSFLLCYNSQLLGSFKGDSFQLKVAPEIALIAAIHIKARLKQHKGLDVRTAIGLGEETYTGKTISKSNGQSLH